MINVTGDLFLLNTDHTTYAFRAGQNHILEHLHYGASLPVPREADAFVLPLAHKVSHGKGTTINYEKGSPLTLEDMPLEYSSVGKGDFREPAALIVYADGSRTSDFVYDSYEIRDSILPPDGMPCAYAKEGDEAGQLIVHLLERCKGVRLDLIYTVFPKCDVITRRAVIFNDGEEEVHVKRLMSMQLDLHPGTYRMVTFGGHWAREMERHETLLNHGVHVNHTMTGTSSNKNNPFVMLAEKDCTELAGDCYAFNLVYSGNHYEACEVSGFGDLRFVSGIDPTDLDRTVEKDASFSTPEAVLTYSPDGFSGISRNMHAFVRKHIVRGTFRDRPRPILLNSWEAAYFHINEFKLLRLAKKAKEAGIELLVMDDGWFKNRNDDTTALGDWVADKKKLPGGIKRLSKKVHELGLQFGIWVEPEMISGDSDLFREHPDYAMQIPGREQSLGRNQMLLDLTNPAVRDYVKNAMRSVFKDNGIDYVKWDMNRLFSDAYSGILESDRQGEATHRWVLGLYDILDTLMGEFPEILFEGCSSGGNRFDLGMLCYFPQIWGSDDTDAVMRTMIQTGYSYGYPLSTVSAHVSASPNHQTLRNVPLYTRFNVAAFGVLGYEINLCDLKKEELQEIAAQTALYRDWQEVFFAGDFYRITEHEWMVVSKDGKRAVAMIWNELNVPNGGTLVLKCRGLDEQKTYHVYNLQLKHDLKDFGNLVNMVAPVHVKQDSLLHHAIAKFVKMDGEVEDYTASGALLNGAGIVLSQEFGGTGYEGQTRLFQDFASRMYFFEEVDS